MCDVNFAECHYIEESPVFVCSCIDGYIGEEPFDALARAVYSVFSVSVWSFQARARTACKVSGGGRLRQPQR